MSQFRKVHRILAFLSFLVSFATYYLTCYPSISFGDSGALAAAAFQQQVPDAPGAPLWIVAAGTFARFIPGDPAQVLTLFSTLCGALASMMVYLIVASLITSMGLDRDEGGRTRDDANKGEGYRQEHLPSSFPKGDLERIPGLVGGLIAALSFAWFDSQWSNATRITAGSAGTLIVALVLWLAIRWYRAEREGAAGSLRWILLAAYVLGLAIGVDHLALDVIPGLVMIAWIGRITPEGEESRYALGALLAMVGLLLLRYALGVFAPFAFLPFLVVALVATAAVSAVERYRRAAIACGFVLVFFALGWSTYAHVALRAAARPPLNHIEANANGDPEVLSYIHTSPLAVGRMTPGTLRPPASSTLRSTVGGFYTRYLLWNTVGRASDLQGAPATLFTEPDRVREKYLIPRGSDEGYPLRFYAVPLLLALAGLVLSFRTDWRTGTVLLTSFLSLGPVSAAVWDLGYDAHGEHDGLIASSLLVVAVWIGVGAASLARTLRATRLGDAPDETDRAQAENLSNGVLVLCFVLVPLNLLYGGWKTHDRSHDLLPRDFAWNLLQSCDSSAILFVDDASPLRHAQDVEGVRRDVRVVDLGLAGEVWYRNQIREESVWNAGPIATGIREGALIGKLLGRPARKGGFGPLTSDTIEIIRLAVPDSAGMSDTLLWRWQGRADRAGRIVYDERLRLIRAIVEANAWQRPIYFSMTVDPSLWGGLETFFRWEGLAFHIVPGDTLRGVEGYNEFPIEHGRMTDLLIKRFRFNGLDGAETATFTAAERGVIPLYRRAFIALAADALKNRNRPEECVAVLNEMDRTISFDIFPLAYWSAAAVASLYSEAGDAKGAERYARHAISRIDYIGRTWRDDQIGRRYNPHQTAARMHALTGDYDKAILSYQRLDREWSGNPVLRGLMEELRVERHLARGDTTAAIAELRKIIEEYGLLTDPAMQTNREAWEEMLRELE